MTEGGRGGTRAPGRRRSPGRGAGRAGVSAHLLMAGIWGVIERGGRPGARVGLHEQLNVIRPGPSGSSWVIDNPAAFLPARDIKRAAGGGRGGGAVRGDPALVRPALPFSPATPKAPGRNPGTCPLPALGSVPCRPARCSGGGQGGARAQRPRSEAGLSPQNPARNRWNRGRKDEIREEGEGAAERIGDSGDENK